MNYINKVSDMFLYILYEDDTSLNISISVFAKENNQYISPKINTEINLISEWLPASKLTLNVTKTKYMIFRYPRTPLSKIPK